MSEKNIPLLEEIIDKGNLIIKSLSSLPIQESITRISEIMPKHILTVFFADYLKFEVNNGGYSQFFYNSRGLYNSLVEKALTNLGAKEFLKRHQDFILFIKKNQKLAKEFLKVGYFEDKTGFRDQIDTAMGTKFNDHFDFFDLRPKLLGFLFDYAEKHNLELKKELSEDILSYTN